MSIQIPDGAQDIGQPVAIRAKMAATSNPRKWDVVLIAPGKSLGYPAFYWPADILERDKGVFEGVDVMAFEITEKYLEHLSIPDPVALTDIKKYLIANRVGTVKGVNWDAERGVVAQITFLNTPAADTLLDGLTRDPGVVGLSVDTGTRAVQMDMNGEQVYVVTKITGCSSVDVVTRPAAGGQFMRAAAALSHNSPKGGSKMHKKLLDMLKASRPDLLEGKDPDKLTEDDVFAIAQMAFTPSKQEPAPPAEPKAAPAPAMQTVDAAAITSQILQQVTELTDLRAAMGQALTDSGLPEMARKRISKRLADFKDLAGLEKAIKEEQDYIAQMSVKEQPDELGSQTRRAAMGGFGVGAGAAEKFQLAVDRLLGLGREDVRAAGKLEKLNGDPLFGDIGLRAAMGMSETDWMAIPRFAGIREAYIALTGDSELSGRINLNAVPKDLRAAMMMTSLTLPLALGTSMHRALVKAYRTPQYGEELLISMRKSSIDFKLHDAVMVGYFPNLVSLDTDVDDYQEIAPVTEVRQQYRVGEYGNILTLSRKFIANDDIGVLQRAVQNLGKAARRTHAQYVWNFFINNSNAADGTAWFTGPHGNLTANALTFATALTAYQALAAMTEQDSAARIGWLDDSAVKPVLVYPIELMQMAESIVNDDDLFTANDLTTKQRNTLKGKISGRMVGLFTDTNDWGLIMPPTEADHVHMAYLNGAQEPALSLSDSQVSSHGLLNGSIKYKIDFPFGGAVVDHRGAYKGVVA